MVSQIPPNTIQQIEPISKALSSLSPLSAIVASVDDSIKSALEATRVLWFVWLVISTVLVFLGVVLEEAEGWMPYLKRLLPLTEITEYRLTKKLAKLGWIFIVVGVMGEGAFEVLVTRADNRLHQFDEALLNQARREAGDAATSAKTAHEESKAVKVEADSIQGHLDTASAQLSGIEQQVRIQGPRWKLLEDNKSEFIRALVPFAPQRVTIIGVKCGDAIQTEPQKLAWDLVNFLGVFDVKPNAGWKGMYREWHTCKVWPTAVGGNLVVTSSSAARSVKDAAKALSDRLNKIGINTMGIIAPDSLEYRNLVDATEGTDSPESLALKDPTQVFIMVGTNPTTVDTFGWRKLHKRSRP